MRGNSHREGLEKKQLIEKIRKDRKTFIDIAILAIILTLAVWMRVERLWISNDDGIYLAACGLIMKGYVPYRDFFLSQPPFFFWLVVGLWRIFNITDRFSMWFLGKFVNILAFLGNSILLYFIGTRVFRKHIGGLLAVIFYQFSSYSFIFSIQFCPQVLATFLALLSLTLVLLEISPLAVGFLLGLAVITRFSCFALVPILFGYYLYRAHSQKKGKEEMIKILTGFSLPLLLLLVFPVKDLWYSLVYFHSVKAEGAPFSLWHFEKLAELISGEELQTLTGIAGATYLLTERNKKTTLLSLSALSLLLPYFLEPVAAGHLLIESAPFFALLTGIVLDSFPIQEKKQYLALALAAIMLIQGIQYVSSFQQTLEFTRRWADNQRNVIMQLVGIVSKYTSPDEMIFCQMTNIGFLSGRPYPPIVDTSETARYADFFTTEMIEDSIIKYPIRLLIVTKVYAEELKEILAIYHYALVERADKGKYFVFLKLG